jgi:hypothetical protein
MNFVSLQPFIPSGDNFERFKRFFRELCFELEWEQDRLAGFRQGACRLQPTKISNHYIALSHRDHILAGCRLI